MSKLGRKKVGSETPKTPIQSAGYEWPGRDLCPPKHVMTQFQRQDPESLGRYSFASIWEISVRNGRRP